MKSPTQGRDPAKQTRDNDLAGRLLYLVAVVLCAAVLVYAVLMEVL